MRYFTVALALYLLLSVASAVGAQTPEPTPAPWQGDLDDAITDIDSLGDSDTLSTDGNQIYDSDGQPMLPDFASESFATAFSYIKYIFVGDSRALFGPFAPIYRHIRIAFVLALPWMVFYFVKVAVVTGIKLALFIIRFALRVANAAANFADLFVPG